MMKNDIIDIIEHHLRQGRVFEAHNEAITALKNYPDNLRINQLYALSLARCGLPEKALVIMEKLYRDGFNDSETCGILGRIHKDIWKHNGLLSHVLISRNVYFESFNLTGDSYTGINAAAMSLVSGDKLTAVSIGNKVFETYTNETDYWSIVTLGEACLINGNQSGAAHYYNQAYEIGKDNAGNINSSYQQLLMLSDFIEVPHDLIKLFSPPVILAFSGHMIDHPDRVSPRFPEYIERIIRKEIDAALDELGPVIGYSSAACGADIIFIEAMVERGSEVNVILPFSIENFKKTSISFAGDRWLDRFEKIISKLPVKYVTEEDYYGQSDLFSYTNSIIMGMTHLRSRILSTNNFFLSVLAGSETNKKTGGTRDLIDKWPDHTNIKIINTENFFHPITRIESISGQTFIDGASFNKIPFGIKRLTKCIMFADIVGFSKLNEDHTPYYMYEFLKEISNVIGTLKKKPEVLNTWGDSIFLVFDNPKELALLAFNLISLIRNTEWGFEKLPVEMNVRIALHAGPVFIGKDPISNRLNAYGSHINRTARIEPITIPGSIYASEQFAALLALDSREEFIFDHIGVIELPKGFGKQEIYQIRKKD